MTGSKFLEEGGLDKKNIINNFFFLWGRGAWVPWVRPYVSLPGFV